ncbi:enoyl-CoA hydratase/isomerase family protein [Pseudonocardia sp.]|uniref:enoyl-CoA hydratase/isomerase family protein n=1 Tax=Pseudonocardia sp. TaxID=60912 RepID=UPI0031FD18C7
MTVADIPSRPAEPPVEGLLVERSGTVLTITINRPRRKNAIDPETWQRLLDTLTRTALDESVRSVVLTGAGGDFCAGADLASGRRDVHPLTHMRMARPGRGGRWAAPAARPDTASGRDGARADR